MTNQECTLVLNAVPGMRAEIFFVITQGLDHLEEIFKKSITDLMQLGLTQQQAVNILHFPKDKFIEAEYNLLRQKNAGFISILDPEYPALLKEIKEPPLVLYTQGRLELLRGSCIAMVGSRQASPHGIRNALQFAKTFSRAKLCIVSGLASGIDTAAHQGALTEGGSTIAVQGCGLSFVYPRENVELYRQIVAEGLVLSEYPMNTAALHYHFPRRNRIISGLSLATVVMEAAEKSGALLTVEYALEQSRVVFAVPGGIHAEASRGCNRLIKEGACVALSPHEVLEDLSIEIAPQRSEENIKIHLSEGEYLIYQCFKDDPLHLDGIAQETGRSIGLIMADMLQLEIKGMVKQMPGQFYIRN